MKFYKVLLFMLLSMMVTFSYAKEPPQMQAIAEWSGPFKGTVITKYADYSDGVACYVYAPRNISTSVSCSGGNCGTQFNGDIGSISCVKLIEPKKKK